MKEEYIKLKLLKEELWNIRYEQLKNNPSGKWSLKDLITVTKTLKNGTTHSVSTAPSSDLDSGSPKELAPTTGKHCWEGLERNVTII